MSLSENKQKIVSGYSKILNIKDHKKQPHYKKPLSIASETKPTDILEKIIELRKTGRSYKSNAEENPQIMSSTSGFRSPQHTHTSLASPNSFFNTPKSQPFLNTMRSEQIPQRSTQRSNDSRLMVETDKNLYQSARLGSDRPGAPIMYDTHFSQNASLPTINNKKEYNPYLQRDLTLEDLFRACEGLNKELHSVISEEYTENLQNAAKSLHTQEFINLQKKRFQNSYTILERKFVEKVTQNSRIDQELWKIVSLEFKKIRMDYDNCIKHMDKMIEKISAGKEKVTMHQMDAWDQILNIIEHSHSYRQSQMPDNLFNNDHYIEKLKTKIQRFKIDFKTKKGFQPEVLHVFESVESHIEYLNGLIDQEIDKQNTLKSENDRLLSGNQELLEKQTKSNNEIIEMTNEWKKTLNQQTHDALFDPQKKIMEENIKDLERKNQDLRDKLASKKQKLKEEARRTKTKINLEENVMIDRETQVGSYGSQTSEARLIKLNNYLNTYELSITGAPMQPNMTLCIMNLMLTDKMITDFADDFERRPRISLKNYVIEWFLKRFGMYSVVDTIIKDFIVSLKQLFEQSDRVKIFAYLAGIEFEEDLEMSKQTYEDAAFMDRAKIQKIYYTTAEALKLFFKIINYIKYDYNSNLNQFFSINTFGPYLPQITPNSDLMSTEVAQNVMRLILIDEGFNHDEIQQAEEHFKNLLHTDLYQRLYEDGATGGEGQQQHEKKDNEVKFLRVDPFIHFIMEMVVAKEVIKVEKFYTVLKANIFARSDGNLGYEEFRESIERTQPNRSIAWREHTYAKLMDESSADQVPLHKLITNIIPNLNNEEVAKEFYQKITRKKDGQLVDETAYLKKKDDKKNTDGSPKTFSAATNSSQAKILGSYRDGVKLGNDVLDNAAYSVYDIISSIVVLQESHKLFKLKIRRAEKNNENIGRLHEDFLREFEKIPSNMMKTMKNEQLIMYTNKDLVDYIEYMWCKFRELIMLTYRTLSAA